MDQADRRKAEGAIPCVIRDGNLNIVFRLYSVTAGVTPTEIGIRMNGLWAFERNLIVDPRTAVFPLTCSFTGEPVDEMTVMTLAQVKTSRLGALVGVNKKQMQMAIPVSVTYKRKRAAWSKKVRFCLVMLGIILAIAGISIPLLIGLEGEALVTTISVAIAFAVLALIVVFCFPYLDDMNDSNFLSGIRFLDDGRILIPRVQRNVLTGLPRLRRGFFGGLLGNQSLIEK